VLLSAGTTYTYQWAASHADQNDRRAHVRDPAASYVAQILIESNASPDDDQRSRDSERERQQGGRISAGPQRSFIGSLTRRRAQLH
jgi:hypothetical protein